MEVERPVDFRARRCDPVLVRHLVEEDVLGIVNCVLYVGGPAARLTSTTPAECTQPLIGGKVEEHSVIAAFRDSRLLMSQLRVRSVTLILLISAISAETPRPCGPDLERRTMYLAPLSIIQNVIARPRPPRPPAIT